MTNDKITPLRSRTRAASQQTYNELFADSERYIRMKLKWRGLHTLIAHELGQSLDGAEVVDIGCGFGRFSFLAALDAKNVEFYQTPIEDYETGGKRYDIVVLGGVLEHLIDADSVLSTISSLVRPGGLFVSNSPTESNFRGTVSTTLWTLLKFPMSLSDVRLITHADMDDIASMYGFTVEKRLGVSYQRAWGSLAATDLKERLTNVLRDVGDKVSALDVDKVAFDRWVDDRVEETKLLLSEWVKRGLLKEIPSREPFEIDEQAVRNAGLPFDAVSQFLAPDFSIDPWYSDVEPYNLFGGQTVYFLRKNGA